MRQGKGLSTTKVPDSAASWWCCWPTGWRRICCAGWGLCGVCPGPAITGLGTGNWDLLWAVAGIALGALVQGLRAE